MDSSDAIDGEMHHGTVGVFNSIYTGPTAVMSHISLGGLLAIQALDHGNDVVGRVDVRRHERRVGRG